MEDTHSRNEIPTAEARLENRLAAVLYGENKDIDIILKDNASSYLDRLLAYRPPDFARHNIQEIDQTLKMVTRPADPFRVSQLMERARSKGWLSGPTIDDAHTYLGGGDVGSRLLQPLWEMYHESKTYQKPEAPEDQPKWLPRHRAWVERCHTAKAAAILAKAQLPEDASEADIQAVQNWVKLRTAWLSTIVTAEGIERTALAFGDIRLNQSFINGAAALIEWLKNNNHPQLSQDSQVVVRRINDFMKQNFFWLEEYDTVNAHLHTDDVVKAAMPLVNLAKEWITLPEYQQFNQEESKVFNASYALERLGQTLPTLPTDEQSQFRRAAVERIHLLLSNQLINLARNIRSSFQQAVSIDASAPLVRYQEALMAFEGVLGLTSQQRHELHQAVALLAQRAMDLMYFKIAVESRAKAEHTPMASAFCQELFDYTPKGAVTVLWESPLAIEVWPSTNEDYDTLSLKTLNSGGVFYVRVSKTGLEVPIIVIKPGSTTYSRPQILKHEEAHAAYSTKYDTQVLTDLSQKSRYINPQITQRLERITDLHVMPRAKNEIVAYLYQGKSFAEIGAILRTDPLYDYFSKNRQNWGFGDQAFDPDIRQARINYKRRVHQALQISSLIQKENPALAKEDLAVLLAILPLEQWKHLLPTRRNR